MCDISVSTFVQNQLGKKTDILSRRKTLESVMGFCKVENEGHQGFTDGIIVYSAHLRLISHVKDLDTFRWHNCLICTCASYWSCQGLRDLQMAQLSHLYMYVRLIGHVKDSETYRWLNHLSAHVHLISHVKDSKTSR